MKKGNKRLGLILLVLVVILSVSAILINNNKQSFTLIGTEVWIPKYFTAECVARTENMYPKTITSHTDNPTWYSCNTKESGTYIPIVSGVYCEYEVSDYSAVTAYICDVNGGTKPTSKDDSRCKKETGFFDIQDGTMRFNVNAGDSVYIDTDKVFGDAKLIAKYPAYGLRVRSADGFVSATSTNCEINSLSRQYHTTNAGDRTEVIPMSPFNAVSGLQKGISTQAVTLSDVENGKEIYITRPNYYYMIKVADDGFKYVDTAGGEKSSSNIECIPRTTGCSDDAKIVNLVDQSCDKYGGAITGYAPVQGDSTRLCKYSCSTGTLSLTSDCIAVASSCPADKPLWDTTTGLCVAAIPPQEQDTSYSYLLYIVGGVVILLLLARWIKNRRK
jgi:hypothetical protein